MFRQLLTRLATAFRLMPRVSTAPTMFKGPVQIVSSPKLYPTKRYRSARWWEKRKARLKMQRESRRRNRV